MTEVEDDLFVSCLSGTALPGYFQLQAHPARPLHQESQMFSGMEKDVIAGGTSGIGSVLLSNISSPVEHMHMIYIVYPCKHHVYTWYIQRIFLVYVDITVYIMYIPCTYMVYT